LEHDLQEARTATESASTLLTEAITREDVHQRHLAEATREFGRRREALQAALEAAKFRDVEDFESARRDPATQERMEIDIRAYGEALASAEARQQRAAAQTENQVMPDLEALAQAHTEAQHQLENAAEAQTRLETQLQQLRQHREALEVINTARLAKDRRHSILSHLAQVARGDEGPRIPFERFVQGAILDEVLASASQRLLRMSRGRYTLRRASSALDLRKSGGLELEVPDAHTGRARAASTLSGGEGFQASLALALGLSDIVQRHAGGVRLDTVFVDEGFGSLDSEALDLALGTLEDLKQEGRLVGIISHLEEVKQRISARLEVQPGILGSRAAFRFD
jgi:exonuclease SbcC